MNEKVKTVLLSTFIHCSYASAQEKALLVHKYTVKMKAG